MATVRDFADELEGYAYLPRMFDNGPPGASSAATPMRPSSVAHSTSSCMARLRVYPETVLQLVGANGDDDSAILTPAYASSAFRRQRRCGSTRVLPRTSF